MRKNRYCRRKYCNSKIINTELITQTQPPSKNDIDTIDTRQKRISILFKIIYVIAILFGAVFIEIGKSFGAGLSSGYMIETYFTSFLFCLGAYMIIYVIDELKCLRLDGKDNTRQKTITEISYNMIFVYLRCGFATFVIMSLTTILVSQKYITYIDANFLSKILLISLVSTSISYFITAINGFTIKNKFLADFCRNIRFVSYTVALSSIFMVTGLKNG